MQGGYVCKIVKLSQKLSIFIYLYWASEHAKRVDDGRHHQVPTPPLPRHPQTSQAHLQPSAPHFTPLPNPQLRRNRIPNHQRSSPEMLLPTLIDLRRPVGKTLDPEDIFGSSLGGIFTDDLQNQHGDDPDTTIVYKNLRHGDVEFRAAEVDGEEQRRKMAHYLWNAGVLMAELVGGRPSAEQQSTVIDVFGIEGWRDGNWWVDSEEEEMWSVEGERVVELGAGALS
jgi:hypothetical protein